MRTIGPCPCCGAKWDASGCVHGWVCRCRFFDTFGFGRTCRTCDKCKTHCECDEQAGLA